MTADAPRDVRCPRCRYNLHGLTTPRCPECGFAFDFAQLRSGRLRENIPTSLDRCDPWQPHQVLLRSLYELVRGALRPRRLLTQLDLNGPLAPAWLMLACGTLWLWLLTSALAALATVLHSGASPATALKTAVLLWGPRALLPAGAASLAVLALATLPAAMRVAWPTLRQTIRLGTYLLPVFASYGCIPLALTLCVVPDFALGVRLVWPVFPLLGGLWITASASNGPQGSAGRVAIAIAASLAIAALALVLQQWLGPDALDPPWWAYFWGNCTRSAPAERVVMGS